MTMDAEDHISNEGLAKIEALVAEMAQDFTIGNVQGYRRTVQATFHWDAEADVYERARSIYALAEGAMWVDALCKNLRAAREQLGQL